MKMPLSVYVMSLGVFVISTSEFVIMGLLPNLARTLRVSLASAGILVSGYAIGVVLGAPLLTPFLVKLPRSTALTALMALFALGNTVCALAPGYDVLLAARVVSALAQASFLGLGAVVASQLVPPAQQARAVSTIFLGSTVATMAGAPAGTAFGQQYGWRATFWVLAVVSALAVVAVNRLLPRLAAGAAADLRREFATLVRPAMLRALLVTTLGFGGTFTTFTFIAPMLTQVTGLHEGWVSPILLLFGFGMFLGAPIGGRLADWNLGAAVPVSLIALILVLALTALVMAWPIAMVAAVFLFGVALFATVAPLQMQVMAQASDAPVLSSAFNIAAFNLGNAAGAYAGSLALDHGVALRNLPWVGAAISVAGLALTLLTRAPRAAAVRAAERGEA